MSGSESRSVPRSMVQGQESKGQANSKGSGSGSGSGTSGSCN